LTAVEVRWHHEVTGDHK